MPGFLQQMVIVGLQKMVASRNVKRRLSPPNRLNPRNPRDLGRSRNQLNPEHPRNPPRQLNLHNPLRLRNQPNLPRVNVAMENAG